MWTAAGIGKNAWPKNVSWITLRDGITGWGTSFRVKFAARWNQVRVRHPLAEEVAAKYPDGYQGKCGDNIKLTTVEQARPYTEGGVIQSRLTANGNQQPACETCKPTLDEFGIVEE
jgi:hypothetical protein